MLQCINIIFDYHVSWVVTDNTDAKEQAIASGKCFVMRHKLGKSWMMSFPFDEIAVKVPGSLMSLTVSGVISPLLLQT